MSPPPAAALKESMLSLKYRIGLIKHLDAGEGGYKMVCPFRERSVAHDESNDTVSHGGPSEGVHDSGLGVWPAC